MLKKNVGIDIFVLSMILLPVGIFQKPFMLLRVFPPILSLLKVSWMDIEISQVLFLH